MVLIKLDYGRCLMNISDYFIYFSQTANLQIVKSGMAWYE